MKTLTKMLSRLALAALVLAPFGTPAPVLAQDAAAQDIAVELVIAADVQDRQPVGEAQEFAGDVGQVYAWLRVTGGAGQAVEVVWSHGENTFVVPLEVGGSPWRTWSSKTIPAEWGGPWQVEVRDGRGGILAEASFTVG